MQQKMVSAYARKGIKILWDVEINGKFRHNRPDITIKEKDARKYFVDVTALQDHHVVMKKNKKDLELIKKARTEHHVKLLLQRWSRYQSNSKTILVLLEQQYHMRSTDFRINWDWKDTKKCT